MIIGLVEFELDGAGAAKCSKFQGVFKLWIDASLTVKLFKISRRVRLISNNPLGVAHVVTPNHGVNDRSSERNGPVDKLFVVDAQSSWVVRRVGCKISLVEVPAQSGQLKARRLIFEPVLYLFIDCRIVCGRGRCGEVRKVSEYA